MRIYRHDVIAVCAAAVIAIVWNEPRASATPFVCSTDCTLRQQHYSLDSGSCWRWQFLCCTNCKPGGGLCINTTTNTNTCGGNHGTQFLAAMDDCVNECNWTTGIVETRYGRLRTGIYAETGVIQQCN